MRHPVVEPLRASEELPGDMMDREPPGTFFVIQKVIKGPMEEGDGGFIILGDLDNGVESNKDCSNLERLAVEMCCKLRDRVVPICCGKRNKQVQENGKVLGLCEDLEVKPIEAQCGVEGEIEAIHWGLAGALVFAESLEVARLEPSVVVRCAEDVSSDGRCEDERSSDVIDELLQLFL